MANRPRQEVPTVDTKSLKAIVAEAQDRVITADEGRQLALAIQVLERRLPGFLNSERAKKLLGDEAVAAGKTRAISWGTFSLRRCGAALHSFWQLEHLGEQEVPICSGDGNVLKLAI